MSWNGYGRQRKRIRSILILISACAFLPKAGAQCGSPARWDLSGGRRVTGVPTGIIFAYLYFWYFSGISIYRYLGDIWFSGKKCQVLASSIFAGYPQFITLSKPSINPFPQILYKICLKKFIKQIYQIETDKII